MFLKAFLILAVLGNAESRQQPERAPAAPAAEESVPTAVALAEPDVLSKLDGAAASAQGAAVTPANPANWTAFPVGTMRVAAGPGADDVVDRVQKFYERTQRLTAKFRQTYTNETFGTKRVSDGRLYIKKPGKMRWDYYAKKKSKNANVEKTFVSDGAMLWAVEHDQKQYAKHDLKKNMLPVAITFLYGKGDLRRDFTATLDGSGAYGAKSDYVLKLEPKKPSAQYKTLYLVVDPKNFRVKQSVVIEASGNQNHFQFFEPNTTKAVQDAWFTFNEKKFKGKYRLVKIDKQQGSP